MDITNIPQALIKGLEQKNTEQLVAISRVLDLVLGKTVIATVTSTKPLSPQERTELLKKTTDALAHINKQTASSTNLTPAVKAEISRLLQQQHLIKSPELKWVNLMINNRPVVTYTDRPLATGQSVPVQLQSPQKLVMLNFSTASKNTDQSESVNLALSSLGTSSVKVPDDSSKAMLNELLKVALIELAKKADVQPNATLVKNALSALATSGNANDPDSNLSGTKSENKLTSTTSFSAGAKSGIAKELAATFSAQLDNKNAAASSAHAKSVISENLRNLLPQKDLKTLLPIAVTQFRQLPVTSRLQLVSQNVEQALKSLAEKIRSPEQLSQPITIAHIIKNSGIFFENKLSQLAPNQASSTSENHKTAIGNAYSQDLKGSLLTLLARVTQDLNGGKILSNEQTIKLLQQLGSASFFNPSAGLANSSGLPIKTDLNQAIEIFMQQIMHKPVKELSNKELRNQLLVLLQQHSVHSLAKIQLQQLQSINHELDAKDSNTPSASWQLEIPVKHHNDVHQLHMRIDREWVSDKNESDNGKKDNKKIKQWSVTLRFDLPTLGGFCAQLAIINTQVSATLWAAQEKTFAEVSKQVEGLRKQLETEGINVQHLQCMRGMPPQKPMALSYSLIDTST